MHFHQKTIPQKPTKQATMHTGRHAQTTHTSQRNAFTAYLPSLHLSNYTHHTLYHPHTQHPSPSTIISILIHTFQHIAIQQPPSHPHPQQYSHTTQNAPHNTTSLNLHSNIILFPRKHPPLTNPTLTSTNQATLTNTHNHTIQPTSTTMLHTFKSYQHPTDTIPNTPTLSSPLDLHSNTAPITTYQHTSTTLQYIQLTSQHPTHTLPNAPTFTSPTKNIHSQTDFQHTRITSQHSTLPYFSKASMQTP